MIDEREQLSTTKIDAFELEPSPRKNLSSCDECARDRASSPRRGRAPIDRSRSVASMIKITVAANARESRVHELASAAMKFLVGSGDDRRSRHARVQASRRSVEDANPARSKQRPRHD